MSGRNGPAVLSPVELGQGHKQGPASWGRRSSQRLGETGVRRTSVVEVGYCWLLYICVVP